MEQHRRTHSGVRASLKNPASSEESRTKRLKIERQKKQQTPTLSPATVAANNNIASLPMNLNANNNNNMSNNNIMIDHLNPNNNVAPVAQMEMGLLDPRLMDSTLSFNPEDFSGILDASFQQNLSSLSNMPRPSLHRSSYQESLQGRDLPTTSTVGQANQSPAAESDNSEDPSLSHAPALDALALAASRQA